MARSSATSAVILASVTTVLAAVDVQAQAPRIANARMTTQAVTSLPQTFQAAVASQADIGWIGYAVSVVDGDRTMCCFNSGTSGVNAGGAACCGMCGLEPSQNDATMASRTTQAAAGTAIKLEGPDQMVVLFRVASKQVERVRIFSEDCQLDGGGRDVTWLTGVRPAESIALLESLVTGQQDRRDRISDAAITGIALHADPAADAALERLLATTQPQWIRSKVPFWLGNTRGRRGLEVLQRVIRDDPSQEVKKKAAFGISQSREADAVQILIENARSNADSAVRGESIFWLAQKAGSKAAAAITERIEQDPDTEVKKRAVFALSQLPKDEGVPLMIRVARTNSNPAVRKQAIFWLGQSKDPRALDYFAEILK